MSPSAFDSRRRARARQAAFTLTEIMITMTIMSLVIAGTLTVFMSGLRSMYKDIERLNTDATLRRVTLHVAKETIDSTEFYVFPNYQSLDGSVDLTDDISPLDPEEPDGDEIQLASGDCLVLVTRVTVEQTSNVRQFRIYYRTVTSPSAQGELRYYESADFGDDGTESSLTSLLNAVKLKTTPVYPGSRVLASITRGKPKADGTGYYPIFSTQATVPAATNESVSLNIEVINGKSATNMLSSSTFNYTISPRR
jgi:prepilin-type N-terminal cleavage/methylation domain-containing protein